MYDVAIIGGGPAAVAAGVYAARKKMKTILIAEGIGGQSVVSDGIENWIGEKNIPGPMLAKKLKDHLEVYQNEIDLKIPAKVEKVEKNEDGTFQVNFGEKSETVKAVVVCSGGRHRRLGVPGEAKFDGRGVAFCATCDAPFFKDKEVAVIGGGNSGLEAVVDLLEYASKIYLIARKGEGELRGDPVTQEQVMNSDKVKIIYQANAIEVLGDKMVSGLKYKKIGSEEENEIAVQGIFVEIGTVPNSEIVGDLVELDQWGNIKIDAKTQATNCAGIFAAGDVTETMFRQNNIAVGDAIKALLSAYEYVKKN
jgi:alkyl hydroperoxide reductase subunit F